MAYKCEHLFVTSQGSPYARFQLALKTGRAPVAWAAALELDHVGLEDALAVVLLVVDEPRYARASARWLGRLCLERPTLTLHCRSARQDGHERCRPSRIRALDKACYDNSAELDRRGPTRRNRCRAGQRGGF